MPPRHKRSATSSKSTKKQSRNKNLKLKKVAFNKRLFSKHGKAALSKFVALFSVLVISLGFLGIYSFFNYLNQQKIFAVDESDSSLYSDLIPNLLYVVVDDLNSQSPKIEKINFVIFNKYSRKSILYNVPPALVVDLPGKYGDEEVGKSSVFGGIVNENDSYVAGLKILNGSIFKIFGLKPTNYLVTQAKGNSQFDNFVQSGNIFELLSKENLSNLQDNTQTNMTLRDFYGYHQFLSSVPEDRNFVKTLDQSYLDNPNLIDQELLDISIESPLNTEKLSIAILNGTNIPGTATLGSRTIKNLGGRVVAVSNTEDTREESIIVTDMQDSASTALIKEVFGISKVVSKDEFTLLNQEELDRSDIVVIIGFDIAREM